MTFLAALRHDRINALFLLDRPIDQVSLLTYVETILCPTLRPGDIVISDNLACNKRAAVRRALRNIGARLLPLPNIHQISISSIRSSPNSKIFSPKQPPELAAPSVPQSATCSASIRHRNAPAISPTQAMTVVMSSRFRRLLIGQYSKDNAFNAGLNRLKYASVWYS